LPSVAKSDSTPDRKIPFPFLKNLGGGNFKRICKGTFSGGARAGKPAQAAGLHFSISLGNRCEPRRKAVPKPD